YIYIPDTQQATVHKPSNEVCRWKKANMIQKNEDICSSRKKQYAKGMFMPCTVRSTEYTILQRLRSTAKGKARGRRNVGIGPGLVCSTVPDRSSAPPPV